jgi:chorismate synthase
MYLVINTNDNTCQFSLAERHDSSAANKAQVVLSALDPIRV